MIMGIQILLLKIFSLLRQDNRNLKLPLLSFEMGSGWPPTHSSGSAGIDVYNRTWLNVASFRNNFPIESFALWATTI